MKNKNFRIFLVCLSLISLFLIIAWATPKKTQRTFYQLTVYHYNNQAQEKVLDNYLQLALLPALHRMQIKEVGVFKSMANDTSKAKMLYVLIPVKSLDIVPTMADKLAADKDYQASGNSYINAVYTEPPYTRIEKILLQSFAMAPQLKVPKLSAAKKDRVYELRSYESATEKIFRNKVHMFNEGDEIGLFAKLNFNAIFYSEVIAGSKMPNLMYMTSFESMKDRDAHWKTFGSDPIWKKLSTMTEYQNNVSHIDITFLRPVEYSDY